jgi:hypothetical protein
VDIPEIKRLAQAYLTRADALESALEADEWALRQAISKYCAKVRGGTRDLAQSLNTTKQHISDICHDRRKVGRPFARKLVRMKTA